MKDVVLTINQAMEPVEKGMTKIQETFHQISVSDEKEEKQETEIKIEEHEQNLTGDDRSYSQVLISRDERRKT